MDPSDGVLEAKAVGYRDAMEEANESWGEKVAELETEVSGLVTENNHLSHQLEHAESALRKLDALIREVIDGPAMRGLRAARDVIANAIEDKPGDNDEST